MSDQSTKRMLTAFHEKSLETPGLFTQKFRTPEENFYDTMEVEYDIRRSGRKIAIAVRSMDDSGRLSEDSKYENKTLTAPVYKQKFVLSIGERLLKRQFGETPFANLDFLAALQRDYQARMEDIAGEIRRSIEIQASQVHQTGIVSCRDATGAVLKEIDFKMKTSHKPNASVDWDEASGTNRLKDCEDLLTVVWQDGKIFPTELTFGSSAIRSFLADADVKEQFRKDGTGLGQIEKPKPRQGGTFHGHLSIGQFVVEIWSSHEFYEDPENSNAPKPYLGVWKVVAGGASRLDLTFGAIVQPFAPDPRLAPIGLGRAVSTSKGLDLYTHAYFGEGESSINGSVACRPLCIPTQIDAIACLNAKAT